MPRPCLTIWHRSSGASILDEQRSTATAPWRDFASAYAAAAVDATWAEPVLHTAAFRVGGRPVFWFADDRASVVVDAAAFSHLDVGDATAIPVGTAVVIGTVTPGARASLGDRGVVELLVLSDSIRIYAHLEGEACLRSEVVDAGAYTATFSGEHLYFTNSENRDPLAFSVRIGPGGEITLAGG